MSFFKNIFLGGKQAVTGPKDTAPQSESSILGIIYLKKLSSKSHSVCSDYTRYSKPVQVYNMIQKPLICVIKRSKKGGFYAFCAIK